MSIFPTPCRHRRCPEITTDDYCATHQPDTRESWKEWEEANDWTGSARERGYDARWDRVSKAYRKRHPLCEPCEREGRTTPTALVDHRVPWQLGGAKYGWENLESMCRTCHARKTAREKQRR